MPTTLIRYTVLLSSPSDTVAECRAVEEVIQEINRTHSSETGIDFYPKDWRRDSRADSGDEPQKLLNRQIVEDSDIILAIFKERFGTPTSQYGSGTEEEIMIGLEMGKIVLVYFWEPPTSFVPKDVQQFEAIRIFKKALQSKVMYQYFSDERKLRSQITHDITKLLFELEDGPVSLKPLLAIEGIDANDTLMRGSAVLELPLVSQRTNPATYDSNVRTLFNEVASMKLDLPLSKQEKSLEANNLEKSVLSPAVVEQISGLSSKWATYATAFPKQQSIVISELSKALVKDTATELNLTVSESMFDLGDLRESEQYLPLPYGAQEKRVSGTDKEKAKYERLKAFIEICQLRKDYRDFVKANRHIGGIALAITNAGGTPAHHVNVELELPSEVTIRPEDIPMPSSNFVAYGLDNQDNCENLIGHLYELPETSCYKAFDDALVRAESGTKAPPMLNNHLINPLCGSRCLDSSDYKELIEYAFGDYRFILDEQAQSILIRLSFDRLQQGASFAFPTRLLVCGGDFVSIRYKITADELEKAVCGEIEVQRASNEKVTP